jgi:sucrose phosphorylase
MTFQAVDFAREQSIKGKLRRLYGEKSEETYREILRVVEKYRGLSPTPKPWVSEKDVILITYGDSIVEKGKVPLQTLRDFLMTHVKGTVTGIHLLPFFPYTSDDGFSVVDYRKVNPDLGDWRDIEALMEDFDLMVDAVVNHVSKSSEWFQRYLSGDPAYAEYFIEADPNADYSKVIRPRTLPLLTPFQTKEGTKYVWTTFSPDQIDLNYKNPRVLIEVLDILLMYAAKGARFIRLDAVGFIWKEPGTNCMHLEETHAIIKLMREVIDWASPGTLLITETNVPHRENISYFGNGYDEAHMVYQFPLPPLTLHAFHAKNARKLMEWADRLEPTTPATTVFNFLASHDGIGIRPVEEILTPEERTMLVHKALEHGGFVSYKDNGDGTQSPYELNITYLDALTHPSEAKDVRVKRFLAAHGILLSMQGVPGIYIHSLVGSPSDRKGAESSGIKRRINREKLDKQRLCEELANDTLRRRVFEGLSRLIRLRRQQKAFSPEAKQKVLFLDDRVFSLLRIHEETGERILALVNVSDQRLSVKVDASGTDVIGNRHVDGTVDLAPYQIMWIRMEERG